MEIRLSTPQLYLDKKIETAAGNAGCCACIRWWNPTQARFVLVRAPMSRAPASYAAHDHVIRELLTLDPKARIRTAIAIYDGLDDYEGQKMGSLA